MRFFRRQGVGLLALVLGLAWSTPAKALDLPVPVDKVAHFGVCYILTDQLVRAGMPREQAVVTTLFVGWLKEVVDNQVDPSDLAADAAGALVAGYVRVEWKF